MIFNKHGNESRLAFQELNGNAINSFFHSLFLVFVLFDPANTHLGGGGGSIEYRVIRIIYRESTAVHPPPPANLDNMDVSGYRITTSRSRPPLCCPTLPTLPVTVTAPTCKFVATVRKWWVIRVKFKLSASRHLVREIRNKLSLRATRVSSEG